MEYTPQHQMFETKRLQLLSMYNNAPQLLKGEDADELEEEEEEELEFEDDGDEVEKGGEGSRGGKVIGHTTSGKPIYENHDHPSHEKFTPEDHEDAAETHGELVDEDDDDDPHFHAFMHHNEKASKVTKGEGDSEVDDIEGSTELTKSEAFDILDSLFIL